MTDLGSNANFNSYSIPRNEDNYLGFHEKFLHTKKVSISFVDTIRQMSNGDYNTVGNSMGDRGNAYGGLVDNIKCLSTIFSVFHLITILVILNFIERGNWIGGGTCKFGIILLISLIQIHFLKIVHFMAMV